MTATGAVEPRTTVAAFDLDGTLVRRDCVVPFLIAVAGRRGIAIALVRRPHRTLLAALRRDRDAMKAIVAGGALRGRRVAEVEAIGASFAARVQRSWLRADVLARLRWHQRSGHHVVIVSASLDAYAVELGRLLEVDAVLCTRPERESPDGAGRYADGLAGHNCRGEEKARRLRAWMAIELGDRANAAALYAYGDSAGDDAMLAMADHPLRYVHGRRRRRGSGSAAPTTGTVPAVPDGSAP